MNLPAIEFRMIEHSETTLKVSEIVSISAPNKFSKDALIISTRNQTYYFKAPNSVRPAELITECHRLAQANQDQ
jgi:hypothetical protein